MLPMERLAVLALPYAIILTVGGGLIIDVASNSNWRSLRGYGYG